MAKKEVKKSGLNINFLEVKTAKKILYFLSKGYTQKELQLKLVGLQLKPNSIRSIELYLAKIKEFNEFKTVSELMYHYGKQNVIYYESKKSK